MTISEKRKRSAERQRKKRVEAYFKGFDSVRINKKNYAVLDRRQINGEYYFLLQGVTRNPFIAKLVYSSSIKAIRICSTSNCYKQNKEVFTEWIKQTRIKQKTEIQDYYERVKTGQVVVVRDKVNVDWESEFCKLVSKKKYKGKHYFIIVDKTGIYSIVKIVYYDFPKAIKVSAQELEKNKEFFEPWLERYKSK